MTPRFVDYYMDIAERTAQLSRARRLQVGAIIVKESRIITAMVLLLGGTTTVKLKYPSALGLLTYLKNWVLRIHLALALK
jgi:hypothetical protein